IAGMFLAPFGMLIAKWSTLKASIDETNILMVLFICFGSATTAFYWTKWMGKLLNRSEMAPVHDITRNNEMVSLVIHTVLMIGLCLLYPLISGTFVAPLGNDLFGVSGDVLAPALMLLLTVIICAVFAIPFIGFLYAKNIKTNRKLSYVSGINAGDNKHFIDSMGELKEMHIPSFYFQSILGDQKLMVPSQVIALAALIIMIVMVIGGAVA
ncbi:MAG: NADH-quinone oxidoreductase subunit L, partial [Lachnospiraceae bacterium]|nr:NADH-quinone oxidoreductase subunit L [Candidatus Equihabitans merdae]